MIPQFADEIVVDLFAGGGGASEGIEQGLGTYVDIAINHDPEAVALHQANHPRTLHYVCDVFEVDPEVACGGFPVGLLWASPDCKHFSKAKGGKPVSKKIRGLAWVVVKWARVVRPRVICLENVEEFQTWGPLGDDNRPCPLRKGRTFKRWKRSLENLGYTVDFREDRACDFGAPTIRKRLFLVARCDGAPIVFPAATHGAPDSLAVKAKKLKPWRTAAECIDFAIPCPSIFTRERPLAEATLRRIAKGVMRYVVEAKEPFIVGVGGRMGQSPARPVTKPFQTVTAKADSVLIDATLAPFITEHANASNQRNMAADEPLRTQVAQVKGGHFALVSAFLAKHFTGVVGTDLRDPLATVTSIDHHSLVTAKLEAHDGCTSGVQRAGSTRAAGSARGRDDLETGRARQHAASHSDHAEESGEPLQTRLLDGEDGVAGEAISGRRAHRGARSAEGSDSARVRCEPRGRVEDEQSPEEPGANDAIGQSRARVSDRAADCAASDTATSAGADRAASEGTQVARPVLCGDRGETERVADDRVSRGAVQVSAFLTAYYGSEQDGATVTEPMRTIPTRDRFGLVTVAGEPYAIVDIGMRMLSPRELFLAQGFPPSYQIERDAAGRPLTKTAQVRMCGNSVCPPLARAIVAANYQIPAAIAEVA